LSTCSWKACARRTIKDDYYVHDEARHALIGRRKRKVFRLGDPVRVVVERVDLVRRQVDFRLADQGEPQASQQRPAARNKREKRGKRGRPKD
jgi:transcriptional accessory protein Tex/SPT6